MNQNEDETKNLKVQLVRSSFLEDCYLFDGSRGIYGRAVLSQKERHKLDDLCKLHKSLTKMELKNKKKE